MIRDLLDERDHILLAFDGPICAFGEQLTNRGAADRLRLLVDDHLPSDVAATSDPFDVLRYANSCGPVTAEVVDTQLGRLELEAAAAAAETPGITETLKELHQVGFTITVVSNHSVGAVRAFLVVHDMAAYVRGISARARPDTALLQPDPHLVTEAIRSLGTSPEFCVMISGSVTDIEAAHAAGTAVVAYANEPGKADYFRAHGAEAVIDDIGELRR